MPESVASAAVITIAVDVALYIICTAPSSLPTISLYFMVDCNVYVPSGRVGVRGSLGIRLPHGYSSLYLNFLPSEVDWVGILSLILDKETEAVSI